MIRMYGKYEGKTITDVTQQWGCYLFNGMYFRPFNIKLTSPFKKNFDLHRGNPIFALSLP